jgi:hypothetical protein
MPRQSAYRNWLGPMKPLTAKFSKGRQDGAARRLTGIIAPDGKN